MKNGTRRKSTGSPTGLAKRKVIIEAATQVFAERGFATATVRDIADEADMFSGSLYYYFDTKEAIVEEIVLAYLRDMLVRYQRACDAASDPMDGVQRLIDTAIRGLAENRRQVIILHNDWRYLRSMAEVDEASRGIEDIWMDWIRRGVESGELRGDVEPRMTYRTIMGSVLAIVRWFDPAGKSPIDDVVANQSKIFLAGIDPRSVGLD